MAEDEEFIEGVEEEDETPAPEASTGVSNLRKAYKNLVNEREALKLQVEQLSARQRAIDLKEIVQRKNLPPKIIDIIPGEIDLDNVEGWLDDHADIFKPTQAAKRAKPPTPEQAAAAREAQFRMDDLETSSQLTTGEQAQIAELNAAAAQWKTPQEMRDWYHSKGIW